MAGPVNDKDVAAQISKLYELHQSGALSKSEFENAKRRLLGESPPRMVAQPPSVYAPPQERYEEPKKPRSVGKVLLILTGIVVLLGAIGAFSTDEDDHKNDPTPRPAVASQGDLGATPVPTETPMPTATAIPRTGIQTIQLSVTIQDDWKAWGQGCVGSGRADWVSADNGVAVAPSNASGTAQGQVLGAGKLSEDESQCQWSATLTSRASDAYAIAFDGQKIVCHSNTMLPNDDGFYAAVVIVGGELQCATVTEVSDAPATPGP